MNELPSTACMTSLLHGSSLGWDLQNLEVCNADLSFVVMDGISPFFSSLESYSSSGYLEDALLEFNERSKRRRLLLYRTDHGQTEVSNDLSESYWNANFNWEMSKNFGSVHGISDEPIIITSMSNGSDEEANGMTDVKTPEEETISSMPENLDSFSSSYEDSIKTKSILDKHTKICTDNMPNSGWEERKKRVITRVVYPFALVKPGGVEGDMTINDINERISMPPTRPVRHPVGDFVCRPCVSADGPGLSGKAVAALTRIHTHGRRGTITIIRTKG